MDDLTTQIDQDYAGLAASDARKLEGWNEDKKQLLEVLSHDSALQRSDFGTIEASLHRQQTFLSATVENLFYVSPTEERLVVSTDREWNGSKLSQIDTRWPRDLDRVERGVFVTRVYRSPPRHGNRPLLAYITRVPLRDHDRPGYLVMTVRPSSYPLRLEDTPGAATVVAEDTGRIVFSNQFTTLLDYSEGGSQAIARAARARPSGHGSLRIEAPPSIAAGSPTIETGDPVVVGYAPVTGTDWIVLVHVSTAQAYHHVRTVSDVGFGATLFGVVVIGFVGSGLGRHNTRPINNLRTAIERVESGALDTRVRTRRIDAVGQLYAGFNAMAAALQDRTQTLQERTGQLESERNRFAALLENTSDSIVLVSVDDGGVRVRDVNPAFEATFGRDAADLADTSSLAELLPEAQHATSLTAAIVDPTAPTTSVHVRSDIPDGPRDFQVRVVPITDDSATRDGFLVYTDITEQKEYERSLEALHEATSQLLTAETTGTYAERIVDTALEVLPVDAVAMYLYDTDTGRLVPEACSERFEERTGGCEPIALSNSASPLVQAFLDDVQCTYQGTVYGGRDTAAAYTGICKPISDRGVVVVEAPSAEGFGQQTRTLVDLLVTTTHAFLTRRDMETNLTDREERLAEQNARLTHALQTNDVIRSVNKAIAGASTREEIEHTVCERLVASDRIKLAWIGEWDRTMDGLEPRAKAGTADGYLDTLSAGGAVDSGDPSLQAATDSSVVTVENVAAELENRSLRQGALSRGLYSMLAVPLQDTEYAYGVLTVYATEPNTFGDLERSVFAELGVTIGNAITAAQNRQALQTRSVIELDLWIPEAGSPLHSVAQALQAPIAVEEVVRQSADAVNLVVETPGADPSPVQTALDGERAVRSSRLVSSADDRSLWEVTLEDPTVPAVCISAGATVESMTAEPDGVAVTCTVAESANVRAFVESVRDRYPKTTLVARRVRLRPRERAQARRGGLFELLTERQHEVLEAAHARGYFETPRQSSGREVAAALGISQPTFANHLRAAERKLFDALLEE
jgi:PAS domain S-box-containing protein